MLYPLAKPTMGLVKSLSPKPTARNIARLGDLWFPWVTSWLRRLSDIYFISLFYLTLSIYRQRELNLNSNDVEQKII